MELTSNKEHICASCGSPASDRCPLCHTTYYCCREHQVKEWPQHKLTCPGSSDFAKSKFKEIANQSWLDQLSVDPQNERFHPNQTSRGVLSGHFVIVSPKKLPDPKLITSEPEVAELVGLTAGFCQSKDFLKFFSGDMAVMGSSFRSWATPYALSIYGSEISDNDPFNGDGYGDGRAISIAEVNSASGRWEMQLKGSGTTPFSRGADGRAVLRSSIREFLASEAMHHLGVSTTRAISLIVSESEEVRRRVYTTQSKTAVVKFEKCAISCRVATSFLRVGHVELFFRRFREAQMRQSPPSEIALRKDQLRLIVEHAMFREYGGPVPAPEGTVFSPSDWAALQARAMEMLKEAARRFAQLTADWIRVGFCQGNFNSDNCLVGGRTMDYGPFGFMEVYDEEWCMWEGGAPHFSFGNQAEAGNSNFMSFAKAVAGLFDTAGRRFVEETLVPEQLQLARAAVAEVVRQKLGLLTFTPEAAALYDQIKALTNRRVDYSIFWRELSKLPEQLLHLPREAWTKGVLIAPFEEAFYSPLNIIENGRLAYLLGEWLAILGAQLRESFRVGEESQESREMSDKIAPVALDPPPPPAPSTPSGVEGPQLVVASPVAISSALAAGVSAQMRLVSPKYVPREWMLVSAYTAAEGGDYAQLLALQQLFRRPFDEQPEHEAAFYRRAPDDLREKKAISCMS